MKLCPTCFKVDCKHKSEKFDCDELMVYPIQKLNALGYKTLYCCSGHVEIDKGVDTVTNKSVPIPNGIPTKQNIYIMFDRLYWFEELPIGFHYELNVYNKAGVIEYEYVYQSGDYRQQSYEVISAIQNLYHWIENLKPNELKELVVENIRSK